MGRPELLSLHERLGQTGCDSEASTSARASFDGSTVSLDDNPGRVVFSPIDRRKAKARGILKTRARLKIDTDVPLPVPGGSSDSPARRAEASLSADQTRGLEDPERGLASVLHQAVSKKKPTGSSLVKEVRQALQEEGLFNTLSRDLRSQKSPHEVPPGAMYTLQRIVAAVPEAVEAHAEELVAAGAWMDCVSLLTNANFVRTRGSTFLLACAYEALGAGATAGRLLLEAACRGDVRAMLSLRRLSIDLDAVPGLRLPLTDRSAITNVTAMMKAASQADLQAAFRWFQRLEKAGGQWARFVLAGLHGVGIPQVLKPSMQVLLKMMEEVASQDLAQAQYALGWWYAAGLSPLALQYQDGTETQQHRQESTQEILLAKRLEAICSMEGHSFLLTGVLPHPSEPRAAVIPHAKQWLIEARRQDHAAASNILGEWARDGVGSAPDLALAEQMFRKAAEGAHSLGHLNLGALLKQGTGSASDAIVHLMVAAEHGHADACYTVSGLYKDGVGVEKNRKASRGFLFQAANLHHPDALHDLGVMYSTGTSGVPKHEDMSLRCLKEASELGHVAAKYRLGMALRGRVGHADTSRCLLQQAAQGGSQEALHARALAAEEMHEYREAIKLFSKAARLGHVDAMYKMGLLMGSDVLLALGGIVDEAKQVIGHSHFDASQWLLKAAEAGHHEAQYLAATYLDPGKMWDLAEEVPKDAAKALVLYEQAAEAGNYLAQYRAGVMHQEGHYGLPVDFKRAADLFHMSSAKALAEFVSRESGFGFSASSSPFSSGGSHSSILKSRGKLSNSTRSVMFSSKDCSTPVSRPATPPNDTLMLTQRQQLVENNVDKAWYALGVLYQAGMGRPQNTNEAVRYFRLASNLSGHVQATVALGLCYQRGKGVNTDLAEGFRLFRAAAEQGEDEMSTLDRPVTECSELDTLVGTGMAHTMIGSCFRLGRGVFKDAQLAVRHFRRGVMLGNNEAHCFLGTCFREGFGVASNMQEAVKHYKEAAEKGSPRGHLFYGECLETGCGIGKDLHKAVQQYQRAARYGIKEAEYRLGRCYQKGRGVDKNEVQAVRWLEKAAKQKLAAAQFALSVCYRSGRGVQPDQHKADQLMRMSAKQGYGPARLRNAPVSMANFFRHLVGVAHGKQPRATSEGVTEGSTNSGSSGSRHDTATP